MLVCIGLFVLYSLQIRIFHNLFLNINFRQMAEMKSLLQQVSALEAEVSSLHYKQKELRKVHDSFEHLNKKHSALASKRAKVTLMFFLVLCVFVCVCVGMRQNRNFIWPIVIYYESVLIATSHSLVM
jgi:Flp pilus assembly protein TadB